ncbi:hypothetical protein IEQ34_026702 [Dendrobium chrysotoxum]|uniref:Uncharacterized protein n=1 Tax=Dendrobium chrysotoxum TaxID=161865 RepID=A0AAV7FL39_DENCH|nr:hypothetical protein IEQ34_026702 [Dendrobium chrysotoxum]
MIILITFLLFRGCSRLKVPDWICVAFTVSIFFAPLSIMSVEFMPFNLSLFLTLSGFSWLFYGLLSNDIYVMVTTLSAFEVYNKKQVIQTKSVEFMPFNLSLFLTLSGISWLFYGLLSNDIYVMVTTSLCAFEVYNKLQNILGVSFGFVQLLLYIIYRGKEEFHKDRRLDKVGPEVDTNMIVEECISDKKQEDNSSELRVEHIV